MDNIKKRNLELSKLLKDSNFCTKISIYFSVKSFGDDYDPYENNYTLTDNNPLTIKGYVREISYESLVWRKMGTKEMGAKEIICEEKYASWFRIASRIVIDGDDYEVYREAVGMNSYIQKLPCKTIKVVVRKK